MVLSVGGTAFDALCKVATVGGSPTYVASINGVAERQHGPLSGWMYSVNGVYPNQPCGSYQMHDGDSLVWTYVNVEN